LDYFLPLPCDACLPVGRGEGEEDKNGKELDHKAINRITKWINDPITLLVSLGLFMQIGFTGKGTEYILTRHKDVKDAIKTPSSQSTCLPWRAVGRGGFEQGKREGNVAMTFILKSTLRLLGINAGAWLRHEFRPRGSGLTLSGVFHPLKGRNLAPSNGLRKWIITIFR